MTKPDNPSQQPATSTNTKAQRTLEGHFSCGSGVLIESECLGQTFTSRTSGRDIAVSMPRMPSDWQGVGFLEPPNWAHTNFADDEQRIKFSDETFDWGATSGFKNNADGTQSPEFARVRRWGFITDIDDFSNKFEFFDSRSRTVREIEDWWNLVSTWISIFTKQDFVEIGKTGSGIRVGPIVTWCGNGAGQRVNGSRDTSIPVVNDVGVDRIDEATLRRCLGLAASATQPPDEWLFIRDARSLINARQYRRAVIDSGTAAELAFTSLIDRQFAANGTSQQDRDQKFSSHKGLYRLSQLLVSENAGTAPALLNEELGRPRNNAAHRGYAPTLAEAQAAVAKSTEVVEQAYPLASL